MGGRGGYGGTIVGRAHPDRPHVAPVGARATPRPSRQILFGVDHRRRRGRLHPRHGGVLRPGRGGARHDRRTGDAPPRPRPGRDEHQVGRRRARRTAPGRTLAHGQVPTRRRRRPGRPSRPSVVGQLAEVAAAAIAAWGPVASVGIGVPGPVRPGDRRDPVPGQRPGPWAGQPVAGPGRGRGRRARRSSSTTPAPSASPSCAWAPGGAPRRWSG